MNRLAILPLLVLVGAVSGQELSHYEDFVVFRTMAVTLLDRNQTGNLAPWQEEAEPTNDAKTSEIVVSNSCGFAKYSYIGVKLTEYRGQLEYHSDGASPLAITARARLGEWCHLSAYLFESVTLVRLGFWNDIPYVMHHAVVYSDAQDREYIIDADMIAQSGYVGKLRDIPNATESTSCWKIGNLSMADIERRKRMANARRFDDRICIVEGVYLSDIQFAP
jgi:hypothetical protein